MFKLAQSLIQKIDKALQITNQRFGTPAVTKAVPAITKTVDTTPGIFGLSAGRRWLLDNIARVESGGKRNAMGPAISSGDRAYGYFQFMGNTLKGYKYGKTPQDFVNSTDDQVNLAVKFMEDLNKASGNKINLDNPTLKDLELLYAGWYSGPGVYSKLNNSNYMNRGHSASGYAMPSIQQAMNKITSTATKFTPDYQVSYFK